MKAVPRLAAGMRLGVISPGSPSPPEATAPGEVALRSLGFELVPGRHVAGGTADERARDLVEMLERADIDGIVCSRGGTGSLDTVRAADRIIAAAPARPKPVIGYSDATFVLAYLAAKLGWTTFHGPMLHAWRHQSAYTLAGFRAALMDAAPFSVVPAPGGVEAQTLVPGTAEGELVGGWLEALVGLIGTPWRLDLRSKIVFFEDVRKSRHTMDRMLADLVTAGGLGECAGIVIGEHEQCGRDGYARLEPVFRNWIVPLGVPTVARFPLGHGVDMATLPVGGHAVLDAGARTLSILATHLSRS